MPKPLSLAELYQQHEALHGQGRAIYEQRDAVLAKMVRTWKKNKKALVDDKHYLEIEDLFRGQVKAFAPAFAHRYKLKLRAVGEE